MKNNDSKFNQKPVPLIDSIRIDYHYRLEFKIREEGTEKVITICTVTDITILKEELEARGISQKKFSEVLNVPYTQLNEILNGKRPVTTDFALMMEAALGINPELLINMQSRYNMSVARQKKPLMAKLFDIRKACAAVF